MLKESGVEDDLKPICPEVAGGLPTPRPPSEIIDGDGEDVVDNKAVVVNDKGEDVTSFFLNGVEKVWQDIEEEKIDFAILKARSPSCGSSQIYSGDFSGSLKIGEGVMSASLRHHGIPVYSEEELDKIKKKISEIV